MEQRRYLRCLGQPALFAPTGELIRFRTKKHLALLIYIAVEDRSHRRDRLAELLWPKVSPSEARHSLATALSTLRPRLGPDGLESSRDHVHLASKRVSLDLERLEAGDVLGSEISGPLEVAAFLEGFDIPDSAEFTHWKDRQHARLIPMIKDALVILIDRCRRTGDSRKIERLADRMLALDDLSEEAIRAKMEARAFAGDRLTALEIFEEWKAKLADELQAAPSDLVEGMAVRLRRRGWERTTLPKIPNVPTDQWRGRPFIGRSAEYRVLYEAWEDVRRGTPRHVLVLGDSGVGKSTLVGRLTTAAGLEGAAISRVQCYDLEREIPYSTLNSLVLGLLDRPGVSATAPEALADLSRTVPEVRRRFPNIPAPSDSQGETARIRLTEAWQELLSAVSEEHPVILVVDDLHLADDISLAVLHLVMRRAGTRPIMVILLARPGELTQSPQASRFRESAAALDLREIELQPLSEQESEEMLKSLLPTDHPVPSAAAKRALLRAAAGYPMVLELLVQDWQRSGEQSLALSIDDMTEAPSSEAPAGLPYTQILERITRSLDTTTHNVLNLASLLGQRLHDLAMYAVVDLSVGQTMSGMAELVTRRVLRDGAQGLEFVNEMVRASAYIGVPASVRKVLHGKIADRFIEEHASGDGDLGLEIAWHCIRAGRHDEATPHLLRGARESIRSGTPYAAERGLSTALPNLSASSRNEALLLLAESLQEQSKWQESLEQISQIDTERNCELADLATALRIKGQRRLGLSTSAQQSVLLSELIAFIASDAHVSSRLRAAVEAASALDALRMRAPTPYILENLALLRAEDQQEDDQIQLLLAKSMLFYNIDDFKSSLSCIHAAISALEERNTPNSALAMLYNGLGAIHTRQGAYEPSIPAYLKCFQTACRIGNDSICQQASANLALTFCRIGNYEEAVRRAEQTLSWGSQGTPWAQFLGSKTALLSYAMLNNLPKAEEILRRGSEEVASFGSAAISQDWGVHSADGYVLIGQAKAADEVGWEATTGLNSKIHGYSCVGSYARWVARSSLARGRVRLAHERLDTLLLKLATFDAVDQVEVINAKCWLNGRTGKVVDGDVELMRRYLRGMPESVADQLRRLGMLDFY